MMGYGATLLLHLVHLIGSQELTASTSVDSPWILALEDMISQAEPLFEQLSSKSSFSYTIKLLGINA